MLKILMGGAYIAALMLYLAPAMIADARGRKDAFVVTMVNILLGWTVIGWFAALAWARHPVNERRMSSVTKRAQRAVARITIDSIVERAHSRSGFGLSLQPRLVPVPVRISDWERRRIR
ncbi:superinfection immunity protein [Paraburkholderia saeva]|jgi:hypothetical protein|uniref:Superinfection immunity protein n=1 Tax=Paraburkholderia saeva TaxID=2777537 RepID=A0A9N8X5S8_9BURK|nr:superinfection immunity protein [Paraburkholderia saeva]CAG4909212.1 hypothetical protein R52603_03703 [Paraburkholderia saeva]CAG4912665.1 hypothetical protein R70241_04053 [Paraburkholderia saeva]CAG4926567.1 hypothetical protein LMG31841_05597 [Paraburkholderia saeva]